MVSHMVSQSSRTYRDENTLTRVLYFTARRRRRRRRPDGVL